MKIITPPTRAHDKLKRTIWANLAVARWLIDRNQKSRAAELLDETTPMLRAVDRGINLATARHMTARHEHLTGRILED